MTNQPRPIVLRKKEAAKFLGISIATLDRLRNAGDFAKPVQLSVQAIGFMQKDLEEWLSNRPVLANFEDFVDIGDDGDIETPDDAV